MFGKPGRCLLMSDLLRTSVRKLKTLRREIRTHLTQTNHEHLLHRRSLTRPHMRNCGWLVFRLCDLSAVVFFRHHMPNHKLWKCSPHLRFENVPNFSRMCVRACTNTHTHTQCQQVRNGIKAKSQNTLGICPTLTNWKWHMSKSEFQKS